MARARILACFAIGLAASALGWCGLFAAQYGKPSSESHWVHELLRDKGSISQAMAGPRLVVAGGSGVLFGVRARLLAEELGIPVLNAGLHGALDIDYILYATKKMARPGDTILLGLEYRFYMGLPDAATLVDYIVARDTDYFEALPMLQRVRDMLALSFGRLANPLLVRRFGDPDFRALGVYGASGLNGYGDVVGNHPLLKGPGQRANVAGVTPLAMAVSPEARKKLERFAQWARDNRITLLATHPNTVAQPVYATEPYRAKLREIESLHEEVGIPFVDRMQDSLMDRRFFYDSVYHLDSIGAQVRTDALARNLAPHLGCHWGPPFVPAQGTDVSALVDRQFSPWQPTHGFAEGVVTGPQSPLPYVRAQGSRSTLVVYSDRAAEAALDAALESAQPQGEDVEIFAGPVSLGRWRLEAGRVLSVHATLQLRQGDNEMALVHAGSSEQGLLVRKWRVDTPPQQVRLPCTARAPGR